MCQGLLEAFKEVVPKAETRYCVRHIWANFKLQYCGSTFKELFWSAARATTLVSFLVFFVFLLFLFYCFFVCDSTSFDILLFLFYCFFCVILMMF